MNCTIFEGIEYRHFDHLYAVSACGKVLRQNEPYTPKARKTDGYLQMGRQKLLHRVVATLWLDKPKGANHVHHKNHDKADNRVDNLEWLSQKQHMEKHPDNGRQPMSEIAKEKLRIAATGRKQSEETKEKKRQAALRNGNKPPSWAGKKHKPETIEKMRNSHAKNQSCIVFGVEYPSFSKAGEALGVRPLTLRKRCYSKNFPDYQISA